MSLTYEWPGHVCLLSTYFLHINEQMVELRPVSDANTISSVNFRLQLTRAEFRTQSSMILLTQVNISIPVQIVLELIIIQHCLERVRYHIKLKLQMCEELQKVPHPFAHSDVHAL